MTKREFERVTNALLDGFAGPFFPERIEELSKKHHDNRGIPDELLTKEESIKYKKEIMWGVRTSDDFNWARNPLLKIGESELAILFPANRENRSVALYTKGEVQKAVLDEIVAMFITAFERNAKKDYYRPFYLGRYLKFQAGEKLPQCHYCKKETEEIEFFQDEDRDKYIHQSCMFALFELDKDWWVRGKDGRRVRTSYFIPGMSW